MLARRVPNRQPAVCLFGIVVSALCWASSPTSAGLRAFVAHAPPYLPATKILAARSSRLFVDQLNGGDPLVFAPGASGLGALAFGRVLVVTKDGGRHWTRRGTLNATVRDLDIEGSEIFVVTEEGLVHSFFDGGRWRNISPPTWDRVFGVSFTSTDAGWVRFRPDLTSATQLAFTSDRGETWTIRRNPCGIPPHGKDHVEAFAARPAVVWALCRRDTGDRVLRRSSNGGRTWETVQATDAAGGPAFQGLTQVLRLGWIDDATGWVLGSGGRLWVTSDGGAVWRRSDAGSAKARALVTDFQLSGTSLSVVADGTLLDAVDGGRRWTQRYPPTANPADRQCGSQALTSTAFWQGYMLTYLGYVTVRNEASTPCVLRDPVRPLVVDRDGVTLGGSSVPIGPRRFATLLAPGVRARFLILFPAGDCASLPPAKARPRLVLRLTSSKTMVPVVSSRPPCNDLAFDAVALLDPPANPPAPGRPVSPLD